MNADYSARLEAERDAYRDQTKVHDALPAICFYWLNRYILPRLAALGVESAEDFFLQNLARACERSRQPVRRFVSIGAGDCDVEINLALALRRSGVRDFSIDCLDLNPDMLERGRRDAAARGVEDCIRPLCADFNAWEPREAYDAVIANQALHHVLNLEGLLDAIRSSLVPQGLLVVSDMIGRNGHRRWPEALPFVEAFWDELPNHYRYNNQLDRAETVYPDWDCSLEGFEGIRAQDILPLLLRNFGFEFFFAFSNITDPFIDRGFGPNFDPARAWDRDFIDRVHACDDREIRAGRVKPTHMLAVLTSAAPGSLICEPEMTPHFCMRLP